jgi:hypothetical protein
LFTPLRPSCTFNWHLSISSLISKFVSLYPAAFAIIYQALTGSFPSYLAVWHQSCSTWFWSLAVWPCYLDGSLSSASFCNELVANKDSFLVTITRFSPLLGKKWCRNLSIQRSEATLVRYLEISAIDLLWVGVSQWKLN